MELGVSYQRPVAKTRHVKLLCRPAREPALGPPAFPHRASNSENPIAVISHHYQDSTHISSSVVTGGATVDRLRSRRLDSTARTGRKALGHRAGCDRFIRRARYRDAHQALGWAVLDGRINNREETHPDRDNLPHDVFPWLLAYVLGGHWVSTLVWGRNNDLAFTQQPNAALLLSADKTNRRYHIVTVPTRVPGYIYNSFLAESTLRFGRKALDLGACGERGSRFLSLV
jgi:hypothetical protein